MPRRSATNPLPAKGKGRDVQASPKSRTPSKKRKRKSDLEEAVPEEMQCLRGVAFFYFPNDDVAPFRKSRIERAKSYGARWVKDLRDATHVFVDSKLTWKDIAKAFPPDLDASNRIIVKEVYPIDCIKDGCIHNPNQVRYHVKGCSYITATTGASRVAPRDADQDGPQKLAASPPNGHKWDHVPRPGAPLLDEDGSANHPVAQALPSVSQARRAPGATENGVGDFVTGGASHPEPEDELAQFVQMAREMKDIPLDGEEEVIDTSTKGEPDHAESDSEGEGNPKQRAKRKDIKWEDRFACNRAGTAAMAENNPNARTIEMLQQLYDCYEKTNDHWRSVAYRKAISTLKSCEIKITTAEEAIKLPGVGQRLADKIEEVVQTDKLKRLDYALNDPKAKILALFMGVYGVGHVQAQKWVTQGFQTLDDLRTRAKLTPNQLVGLGHYDDLNARIPRREMTALGKYVMKAAAKIDPQVELLIGGSYRRGSDSSGDIDFIVTKKGTQDVIDLVSFLQELVESLTREGFLTATLAALHSHRSGKDGPGSKWHGCCVLPRIAGSWNDNDEYRPVWRRIDFLLVPESEYGAALIYFTGDDIFNRSIRLLASKKGMRLNQRGLFTDVMRGAAQQKPTDGVLVEGRDEKKIFEALGVPWKPPEERVYS